MDSIKILVNEHDNILRMLDVVHHALLKILNDSYIDTNDFKNIVNFIRIYADKIHHGKEEDYIFKAMVDNLGQIGENLVNHGMMVEHNIARLYVADIETAINAYEDTPNDEAKLALIIATGSYEQLLRRHIQKENEVVFPFCERSLSPESISWVEDEVANFENNETNTIERSHQLAILDQLEKKYIS